MSKRPKAQEYATNPEFIKQLETTNVMHLRPDNNITYVCSRNDTVFDVWKGLNRHNFQSVPVLGAKEKYEGFIDLADIVGFFANWFSLHTIRKYPTLHQLIEVDKAFLHVTVDKLMVAPGPPGSPFLPVKRNFSLLYCMEILAREPMQRVPIVNEEGVLWNFLTQSHVVQYLHQNIDKIGTKRDKPISQMKDVFKHVHTVGENQLAYDAFMTMNHEKVHGLAVVDDKYHLVGAISVRDLKLVMEEKIFSYLLQPVRTFIQKLNEDTKSTSTIRPVEAITVTGEDSLRKVIDLLVQHKLHRLFVVDSKKHVVGVVGLKEVLLDIISE